jgi:hypothetical protein
MEHFQGTGIHSGLTDAVVRGIAKPLALSLSRWHMLCLHDFSVNRQSTVRQTSVNLRQPASTKVNMIKCAWQSSCIRGETAVSLSITVVKTVPVHRMVERLYRQSSPQNLWVGAYRLSG